MSEKWTKFIGFLGAAANWTIPIASLVNLKNDASTIDPIMTTTLASYSLVFMRWSIAIKPANYWLLGCHAANELAQISLLSKWGYYKLTHDSKNDNKNINSTVDNNKK
ncbi:UPF0041 family protein [Tieghemostelium lacteum]|uniref:Mitochondrial pyruvate carrier n=1 Tax=Tieghemostelium lacteum TaxID=361077 RepID=A0A151ZCX7_TIELA|nr:UPF0041 family protein [Tieghemostelium lacteum]|eukprot:KYQ91808.1 UPF0041 family protein [Tieghemostelium lacteum]